MIFAKVDLTLAYHPKALAAGRAMATWLWALLYSRDQELDGFVPAASLRLSWVGERQAMKDIPTLIAVGLFKAGDAGWWLEGYGAKNDMKAAIDERRKVDRERKRNPDGKASEGRADSSRKSDGFPGSGSGSGMEIGSRPGSVPSDRPPIVLGGDGEGGAAWQAWRDGIGRATGNPVSELGHFDKPDLVAFANAHAGGLRGEALMGWIADTAEAFARACDDGRGFTPKRCKGWLDAGRKAVAVVRDGGGPSERSRRDLRAAIAEIKR